MDFQSRARQNEIDKFEILRIVINDHQSQSRRVSAARAHDLPVAAIKASSTLRINSSRVKGLRRIAVPSSKMPCVAISPSAYPDIYSTPIPCLSASSTPAHFFPPIPAMITSVQR